MVNYIIRRILFLIPTFIILTFLIFVFVRLTPGSVIDMMVAQAPYENAAHATPEIIRHKLGLDQPILTQYWDWLSHFVRGNMGQSLWTEKDVTQEVLIRVPITFELGAIAFIIAQLIAFPVGILSAVRQDSTLDYLTRGTTLVFVAIPVFWLGIMVVVFPSVWWGWSPPIQYIRFTQDPAANLGQFIIPALILGISMAVIEMRMLRTTVLDVLRQDYVRTAWAKGLKERNVITGHVLRNAFIPVITIIAGQIPVMIGGSVIIEQIFSLPGMGRLFVESVFRRDYPYITSMSALFGLIGLVIILLTDLSYAWLDPRIRYR